MFVVIYKRNQSALLHGIVLRWKLPGTSALGSARQRAKSPAVTIEVRGSVSRDRVFRPYGTLSEGNGRRYPSAKALGYCLEDLTARLRVTCHFPLVFSSTRMKCIVVVPMFSEACVNGSRNKTSPVFNSPSVTLPSDA